MNKQPDVKPFDFVNMKRDWKAVKAGSTHLDQIAVQTFDEYKEKQNNINMLVAYMKAIQAIHDCPCYQAGGSLLPHPTRDYDILIFDSGWDAKRADSFWSNYKEMGFSSYEIFASYDGEGTELEGMPCIDDATDFIVKLAIGSIEFDLIYVNPDISLKEAATERIGVMKYMKDHFPLSCQCIAQDILTGERIGHVSVETIVVYKMLDSYKKYQEYYPDAYFHFPSEVF